MVVGAAVLLGWIPLRERPGLGTLSNVVVVGLAVDGALALIPAPAGLVGLVRRTGGSVRLVRTAIEITVVATGWLLGGTLGVITLLYAVTIGPLIHALLPRLEITPPERARR
jgi:uncharacterized membrane protein YczE